MSYRTLFCLGFTTLLAVSLMPTMAVRAITKPITYNIVPSHTVNEQHGQVSLEKDKSTSLVFASEETKSTGVPQGSSRPPRG
ncbi:hypothetical protein [Lyngbya sp. PCC 8106]|uniref:hypothetical protein n=1 Tax=Lyngbya sp. (strain PCC 8106) TaxID=313612 RepID=UPI0012EA7F2F|nr:hypothetical protein [Lyngbya sp. PCC 8106]